MRFFLAVFISLFVALPVYAQPSSAKATPLKTVAMEPVVVEKLLEKRLAKNFVPGEIVVKMKPSAMLRVMSAVDLKRLNLEIKRDRTSGSEVIYRLPSNLLSTLSTQDLRDRTLAAVKSLMARADVEYAQPNFIFQIAATPNDSGFPQQWHYFDNGNGPNQAPGGINLPTAWETNKGKASVVVAVIDTGTLLVATTVAIGGAANGVGVSVDGGRAFVAVYDADAVRVLDPASNALVGPAIPVGSAPFGFEGFVGVDAWFLADGFESGNLSRWTNLP